MKLLYVFPEPLPLPRARGGQVVNTVAAIEREGIEVLLAHAPGEGEPFAAYGVAGGGAIASGLRAVAVSRALPWPFAWLHSNRMFMRRLAPLIGRERPDAVFVRHLKPACAIRRRFPALPIVYEAHEVFADTAAPVKRAAIERLERDALEAATRLIANSHATAERLQALYAPGREIAVIPNGVERQTSMPAKDWAQIAGAIVYAGSLFPWKGTAELVQAAARLPECALTIAGGEEAEIAALRSKVDPNGARIEFAGRLSSDRVRMLLERSCIGVLPNRADAESAFTSPIKLFEYMAAGCAVVASNLPALREILAEDDVVWARAGDPEALAAGIRALIADPARARLLGERLYAKSAQYSWNARGARIAELLRALKRLPR
ncbi:MAG: glycosyltransferase family 4 protein [Betaproteobacteria bacterium]|nr:glycosyltransferase family 4 protein [Betaproteobacteria bacterium]